MERHLLFILCLVAGIRSAEAQELIARNHHPNGRVQSTRYSDGSSTYFVEYHPNGRVAAMGAFRDGRRHGTWKTFDERGVMRARAEFDHGKRSGTWEFRDGADALQGTLGYAQGSLVKATVHKPGGELVAGRTY